jgi:hypothetical protein
MNSKSKPSYEINMHPKIINHFQYIKIDESTLIRSSSYITKTSESQYSNRSITCENDTCPTIDISQNDTSRTSDINKIDKLCKKK